MKRERRFTAVVAVAFVLTSILCSSAQAGSFLGRDETLRAEAGVFDQASAWLLDAWTGLKTLLEAATLPPQASPQAACATDTGWGLDPEGCPRQSNTNTNSDK